MMGGNSKFYSALGGLVMLRGLVCFFHFGGTGKHQGKSIIMGGLPTPCETMGGVCLARLGGDGSLTASPWLHPPPSF